MFDRVSGESGVNVLVDQMSPERISLYGKVYAEACRTFPHVPVALIIENADYAQTLNQAWAAKYGISDYMAEVCTPPCVRCNNTETRGFYCSKQRAAIKEFFTNMQPVYTLGGEDSKLVSDGFVCRDCEDKFHWNTVSYKPKAKQI